MINFLLALLAVAGLVIMFLWLKLKKATIQSTGLKAEQDQRAADGELRIDAEMERRGIELKEKSASAKEAIDRFNIAMDKLRDSL